MAAKIRCHYEVLECEQTATEDELKKSFRKLALKVRQDSTCIQTIADDPCYFFLPLRSGTPTRISTRWSSPPKRSRTFSQLTPCSPITKSGRGTMRTATQSFAAARVSLAKAAAAVTTTKTTRMRPSTCGPISPARPTQDSATRAAGFTRSSASSSRPWRTTRRGMARRRAPTLGRPRARGRTCASSTAGGTASPPAACAPTPTCTTLARSGEPPNHGLALGALASCLARCASLAAAAR